MELRTGIDMVEITRIEQAMDNPRFLSRFFGEEERAWLRGRGNPPRSVAACFCAKEAFAKALGTGISGFSFREVELLREESGKPYLAFSGQAAALVTQSGYRFEVSVTHTREYAAAVVVAWLESGQASGWNAQQVREESPCGL